MKKQRKEGAEILKNSAKGITLVALVVTIIVLIILAAVSISLVLGEHGLLKMARDGRDNYLIAANEEQAQLGQLEDQWDELINGNGNNQAGDIISDDVLPTSATGVAAGKPIQNPASYGANAQATADGNNDYFALPNEFYYAGGTVDTGVVISDAPADEGKGTDKDVLTGNQFVWVPVPVTIASSASSIIGTDLATNPTTERPMAILQSGSDTNYQGVLYDFSGTTSTAKSIVSVIGTSGNREPTYLSGSDYDDNTTYGGLFSPSELQTEYNSIVASVNKYGGFYVARYELGLEGTTPVSKPAGETVTTADSRNTNTNSWYGLYSKCKSMYQKSSSSNITSTMIWGSQYDAMINWMLKTGKTVGTADSSKYNQSTVTGLKANQYEDIINNVYDLYGCHYEWTMEASSNCYRSQRGGYSYSNYAPSLRQGYYPNSDNLNYSTRPSLYIN